MKNLNKIIAILSVLVFGFSNAQEIKNWRSIKPEQRKEMIEKMTPEQRVELLKNLRENMLVDDLDVPKEKQEDFKNLYNEYQESQRKIKENFKANSNYENMSDHDAKRELEQSFVVGQQLLDNRKRYAEKFQRMMRPQQVLEMFQNEGMMRSKMMDRKSENDDRARMRNESRTMDRSRQLQENRNEARPQFRNNTETRNNGGVRPQSRRP